MDYVRREDPTNSLVHRANLPNLLTIQWRFQKNGQNGEKISYADNSSRPEMSVVRAAIRIVQRAARLNLDMASPFAVYGRKEKAYHILHTDVERNMCKVAVAVYGITDKGRLQRFSCHSVQAAACALLHTSGAPENKIKNRLRWISSSFMMYLRNVPVLAALHNTLVNKTDSDDLSSEPTHM